MAIRHRLSNAHGMLCSICEVSLRGRLEAEPEHQLMDKSKRNFAVKLHNLVRKNCNASTYVIVDDVTGKLLESLCSFILIRGHDFSSLPKHLEVHEYRHEILREAGFEVANPKFRDDLLLELENRGQSGIKVCQDMNS